MTIKRLQLLVVLVTMAGVLSSCDFVPGGPFPLYSKAAPAVNGVKPLNPDINFYAVNKKTGKKLITLYYVLQMTNAGDNTVITAQLDTVDKVTNKPTHILMKQQVKMANNSAYIVLPYKQAQGWTPGSYRFAGTIGDTTSEVLFTIE